MDAYAIDNPELAEIEDDHDGWLLEVAANKGALTPELEAAGREIEERRQALKISFDELVDYSVRRGKNLQNRLKLIKREAQWMRYRSKTLQRAIASHRERFQRIVESRVQGQRKKQVRGGIHTAYIRKCRAHVVVRDGLDLSDPEVVPFELLDVIYKVSNKKVLALWEEQGPDALPDGIEVVTTKTTIAWR